MSLVRSAIAFGYLALGLADLLYLNLAMVPALLEEDAPAGIAGPAGAPVTMPAAPGPAPSAPALSVVVSFARGRDELTDRARVGLDRAAARLAADRSATAQIEGHSDLVGERARNLELSQRRAERVADHLVALGVDRSRMTVHGVGERRPLERGADPDASRRNRRVVVRVVAAAADAPALRPEEDAP